MVTNIGLDTFLGMTGDPNRLQDYIRPAEELQAEDVLITLPLTDVGNADRFVDLFHGTVLWCPERKAWFIWNGTNWDGTPSPAIMARAVEGAQHFLARVTALPDSHPDKTVLRKAAMSLQQLRKLTAMMELVKHHLPVHMSEFDCDPYLINCRNGTVDIRTGELRPHDPADLITKVAGYPFIPGFRHPDWDKFIQHATAGKTGLQPFLQQAVGYSATGYTTEEKFFMVIGPTRTGKSTFMEAVKTALGDYAATANFETFLRQPFGRGGSGPSEDLARLAGVRMVSSSEVDDGREMAIAMTKQMTGGDAVTARFLHQNSFTYIPCFALWLVANTEPHIPQDEAAMWERVLRVPLDNEVPPEERDPDLKARLKDTSGAGPAVLSWIVEGAIAWNKTRCLDVPEVVKFSTKEYRERMDPLADFIDDMCIVGPDQQVATVEMQTAYVQWAKRVGERVPLGRNQFSKAMEARGFTKGRKGARDKQSWRGIGLADLEDDEGSTSNTWFPGKFNPS